MNGSFEPNSKVWKGIEMPWPYPMDMHISEMVMNELEKNPDRIVQISADDDSQVSANEMKIQIIRVTQNLKSLGIEDGDVVGMVCANHMDLMALVHGIIQLGAIVNPLSVEHSIDDMINMFEYTKPKLVICDYQIYNKVHEALRTLHNDAPIYTTLGKVGEVETIESIFKSTGVEDKYKTSKFDNAISKTLAVLSSSGTTGPPKAVCKSQAYFLKLQVFALPQESRSLVFTSMFWVSAFSSLMSASISKETRIVTTRDFSPEAFFEIATKFKVNFTIGGPPMLTALLHSSLVKTFDSTHLRTIAITGGFVNDSLRQMYREAFPDKYLLLFYGLSEICVSMIFPKTSNDELTVGNVIPYHEVKIIDDHGNAVDLGTVGEICSRFSIIPFLVR